MVLTSCEKVIDIDLKDAEPVIVIEGRIVSSNSPITQVVKINRSVPFGEVNSFPAVSGAQVTVKDNTTNNSFVFTESKPGEYTRTFTGRPGRTYTLSVLVNGKAYSAVSTMPDPVEIDSVGVSVNSFFGDEERSVIIQFTDPAPTKNYYRFLLTVNGARSKSIFTYDDKFSNGRVISNELFDFDLDIKPGDKAEIDMQCIDAKVFRYFEGLDQNESRGGASTTPANPVSNISNGALGYFSAQTSDIEKVEIP